MNSSHAQATNLHTPTATAPMVRSASPPASSQSNTSQADERHADFIKRQLREREQQDAQREKELKAMTPERREVKLAEERAAAEHEKNKTRHYTRLGRSFSPPPRAGGGRGTGGRGSIKR
jgi:hypothetical protein